MLTLKILKYSITKRIFSQCYFFIFYNSTKITESMWTIKAIKAHTSPLMDASSSLWGTHQQVRLKTHEHWGFMYSNSPWLICLSDCECSQALGCHSFFFFFFWCTFLTEEMTVFSFLMLDIYCWHSLFITCVRYSDPIKEFLL